MPFGGMEGIPIMFSMLRVSLTVRGGMQTGVILLTERGENQQRGMASQVILMS
jgi:hypothetical protein